MNEHEFIHTQSYKPTNFFSLIHHAFGHKSTIIFSEDLIDNCPNCNKSNCLELIANREYVSLFLIPLFPTFKTIDVYCKNCFRTEPLKRMPESIKLFFKNNKRKIKTPIWLFTGSMLLFVFLFFSYIIGTNRHKVKLQKMSTVKKGDIYGYRIGNNLFNACKFEKITKDTIYYFQGKQFVYEKKELQKFLQNDMSQFSDTLTKLTNKEYFNLVDNVDFFEIEK